MKKALALLVVLAVIAIPVVAFATVGPVTEESFYIRTNATNMNDEFYMFPEADVVDEAAVDLPPIVGIPAAGPVALAGVAMVLATIGCALIPKK